MPDALNQTTPATVPVSEPETLTDMDSAPDAAPECYCVLTRAGQELEARAHAEGKTVRLTMVAVGDGDGVVPEAVTTATALVHENHRRAIDTMEQDANDPNICWLHTVFPADVGGWWVREFGVYAEALEDGGEPVLYAYGNHPPYYKLQRVLGQAMTFELAIPLIITSKADVEIVISEAGYATRSEVVNLYSQVRALAASRDEMALTDARMRLREATLAGQFCILADRVTQLELLHVRGAAPAAASAGGMLTPAGYRVPGGATVAPVSIVQDGSASPAGAALTLQIETVGS